MARPIAVVSDSIAALALAPASTSAARAATAPTRTATMSGVGESLSARASRSAWAAVSARTGRGVVAAHGEVQRRFVVDLRIQLGAALGEAIDHRRVPEQRRAHQRGPVDRILHVDVGAAVERGMNTHQVALARRNQQRIDTLLGPGALEIGDHLEIRAGHRRGQGGLAAGAGLDEQPERFERSAPHRVDDGGERGGVGDVDTGGNQRAHDVGVAVRRRRLNRAALAGP